MGKINEYSGAASGLVGTVIISSWRGIKYMKHKGRKPRSSSEKQIQHRAKVGMISKFVYSMKGLLDKSFFNYAIRKTGTNAAFSYNFKNCITGDYPAYAINYSLVLVSRGDLPNVITPAAAAIGNGEVQFSWIDNSGTGMAKQGDKCIGVAHCPGMNASGYTEGNDIRQSGMAKLSCLPLKDKIVETWLVVISADGKEVANSVYTGQVVIT